MLTPFIELTRQALYGHVAGTPIPDPLTAVCWIDGAGPQLNATVSQIQLELDKNMKVITNKHSASRTAVEQPCDRGPCFRSFRKISNRVTRDDIPATGLQAKVHSKFIDLHKNGILMLAPLKSGALIDFIGSYPTIVSKACPTSSVADGFITNGMIDRNSLAYPDIAKILSTCKNSKLMSTHQFVIKRNFTEMYEEFSKKGAISDKFMHKIGICADTNLANENVWRNSDCEMYQRSKCLTHLWQRNRRVVARDAQLLKINLKEVDKFKKYDKMMQYNVDAEQKLKTKLPHPRQDQPKIFTETSLLNFSSCNNNELKSFIHVRTFNTYKIPSNLKWIWPKKGKLVDAQNSEPNLLMLAFNCRNKIVLLKPRCGVPIHHRIPNNQTQDPLTISPPTTVTIEPLIASNDHRLVVWQVCSLCYYSLSVMNQP